MIARPFSLVRSQLSTQVNRLVAQQINKYSTMAERIHRITMFKMPKEEDRQRMIEQFRKMAATNEKDGKPYILSMVVGPAEEDARSQGYNLVSKTEFASMEDMKFYDDGCPAHGQVKELVKDLTVDGRLTVYYKAQAVGGTDRA